MVQRGWPYQDLKKPHPMTQDFHPSYPSDSPALIDLQVQWEGASADWEVYASFAVHVAVEVELEQGVK